jgi:hypothetical protein
VWGTYVSFRTFDISVVAGADVGGGTVTVDTTSSACRNTSVPCSVVRVSGVTSVACTDPGGGTLPIWAPTFTYWNTRCVSAARDQTVSLTTRADIGGGTVSVDARRVASWRTFLCCGVLGVA